MKTWTRTFCFALAAFGAASCQAQPASMVQPELQDGSTPFARYGSWTIYQSGSEMFDNQLSCAAVANLPDSYDAIRIERVADGYVYGVNGFDRESFGAGGEYPIAFWFDGDASQRAEAMGRFVRDPVFPNDDWLSIYRPMDDYESALDGMLIADSVTFAVRNEGNRTGKDDVETTFPLGTFEVVQRGLDRCYDMGMAFARETEGPIPACRDDGPRLPVSGLCASAAAALIEVADGPEPGLFDESCTWVLNDGWFAGMVMLYRAAECEGRVSRLAGSAGAHMMQLELIESAYGGDGDLFGKLAEPIPYADVFARFKDSPAADVQARALYGLQGQVPASCAARRMDDVADGYLVDVSAAERARQPEDEPPAHLCGDYGYGDDADLWRVFQGYAWFFRLGQDAQEIDFRSLTVLEPDGEGGWQAAQ
jgi:hypothetical protein